MTQEEALIFMSALELNCLRELVLAFGSTECPSRPARKGGRDKSWRRLIGENQPGFLNWLGAREKKYTNIDRLANTLEEYLQSSLADEMSVETPDICRAFAQAIPLVLSRCDEDIYDKPFVADAYAFVHLLDRYRRFWDVFALLARYKILPMSSQGIKVLDIGAGPAPAAFATQDFYDTLFEYARETEHLALVTSEPQIDYVESSYGMRHLVEGIPRIGHRREVYQKHFDEFEKLDFEEMKLRAKNQIINDAVQVFESSAEAEWWANSEETWWMNAFRYNLCIFSNFLTTPESVTHFQRELKNVFWSIRPGGVVVVMGGVRKQYPQVYSMLTQVALNTPIKHLRYLPAALPCNYEDKTAHRIKDVYKKVTKTLTSKGVDLSKIESLPRDLWDQGTELKGPTEFGLVVFRKSR